MRDNTPPEARETLERLLAIGYSNEEARRFIGCVVSTAVYDLIKEHRPFDESACMAMLQCLPDLPWEDEF